MIVPGNQALSSCHKMRTSLSSMASADTAEPASILQCCRYQPQKQLNIPVVSGFLSEVQGYMLNSPAHITGTSTYTRQKSGQGSGAGAYAECKGTLTLKTG